MVNALKSSLRPLLFLTMLSFVTGAALSQMNVQILDVMVALLKAYRSVGEKGFPIILDIIQTIGLGAILVLPVSTILYFIHRLGR